MKWILEAKHYLTCKGMLLFTGCFRKDRLLLEITMNTDKTIYIRQKKTPTPVYLVEGKDLKYTFWITA